MRSPCAQLIFLFLFGGDGILVAEGAVYELEDLRGEMIKAVFKVRCW